jgi:predicted nucleotidyltransferase
MLTDERLEEVLDEIVMTLMSSYRPEEIILFGSYAYGEPNTDSDLDLFIVKESDERPIDRRMAVRHLLREINFRVPLTLIVLTPDEVDYRVRIGDQFINEILTRGKVLYAQRGLPYAI